MVKFLALVFALGFAQNVFAHPTSFQGARILMSENNGEETRTQLLYSYRYWLAFGLEHQTLAEDGSETKLARVNTLLKRWLMEDSQANIYVGLTAGQYQHLHHRKDVQVLNLQADWESRKYYVMLMESLKKIDGMDEQGTSLQRVGFAPYLGEFKDLNIWYILERKKAESRPESFVQYLRFYHRNVLWELGYGPRSGSNFNFMIHF